MASTGLITASMRELERIKIIEAVAEGRLGRYQATPTLAARGAISTRRVTRRRPTVLLLDETYGPIVFNL